jgi:hypothetical protein
LRKAAANAAWFTSGSFARPSLLVPWLLARLSLPIHGAAAQNGRHKGGSQNHCNQSGEDKDLKHAAPSAKGS